MKNIGDLIKRVMRYYLYSRRGMGHIAIVLSLFNFVNIFHLVSREWILFKHLGYIYLFLLIFLSFTPLIIFLGYLDYKRGFYSIESAIGIEENPYCDESFTEKERKYLIPLTILTSRLALRTNRLLLERFGINDPEIEVCMMELKRSLDLIEKKMGFNGKI